MSAINDRYQRMRQLSRVLFPKWSRAMRARWVVAKLRVCGAPVQVSSGWAHDPNAFRFARTSS